MRVKVIVNPAAGKDVPVLSALNDAFRELDIDWEVDVTQQSGDATAAARRAAEEGFDLVGAYGGDGTVSEVAAGLAEGGPPMLLLPGGTGNVLASELGIPLDLGAAARLASGESSEVRRVDMGRMGDAWFVLRLTIGFEAELVDATTREMKDKLGWLAYAASGLKKLSAPPTARYSMIIDGERVECEGIAAIVANSAGTGVGGLNIAEDVDISDGFLDVLLVENADLPELLVGAADAVKGTTPRMLNRWRCKEVSIEATPDQMVVSDGEDAGLTPVEVSIVPGAIAVMVPKVATASGQSQFLQSPVS